MCTRQDPETTIKVVKGEGYDLSKLHEDTWEGHPAYVVGADKGDLKSKQFWVTKDTLLFVRDIEPARGDPKKLDDIRFMDYRPLAGAWIAARRRGLFRGQEGFLRGLHRYSGQREARLRRCSIRNSSARRIGRNRRYVSPCELRQSADAARVRDACLATAVRGVGLWGPSRSGSSSTCP